MAVWTVGVEIADGDDFDRRWLSEIQVDAPTETAARLAAHQMAGIPQPGKPDHYQITQTAILTVTE